MPAAPAGVGPASGVHACYVADDGPASTTLLERFARRGRVRGQRVLWLVDAYGDGLTAKVASQVVGGDGASLAPAEVGVAEDVYLADGSFDADRVIDHYRAQLAASHEAGYRGLRVVADTSWLAARPGQFEAFVAYEHRVTDLFGDGHFDAVCHYDPVRLPRSWLRAVADAHPVRGHAGPQAALSAGSCKVAPAGEGAVALAGDVDVGNAAALRGLLAEHTTAGGDLRVDASELGFIDVAGVRALVLVARGLGRGRQLVVHNGPYSLALVADTTGWARERALVITGPRGPSTG